jgi:peptidoglycan/LPS O-acetylase OafA/YrhL
VSRLVNTTTWAAVAIGLAVWLLVATSEAVRPNNTTRLEMLQFGLIAGLLAAVFVYGLLSGFINAKGWAAIGIGLGVFLLVAMFPRPVGNWQGPGIAGLMAGVLVYGLLAGASRLWRRLHRSKQSSPTVASSDS